MKQFIDDPNSLDEGSKAMVCEAVEVLQVSDCNIFSFFLLAPFIAPFLEV